MHSARPESEIIAAVTENIAAVYGRYPEARMWMRLMAATVPRGGGNGDAVRLEILDIMRRNGFKEGHRPGIEDHFIEQWHQKLHTNCAPDDLIIADAYIRFLETGNTDDYWSHLHGNGLSYDYMKNLGGGMGSARSGLDGMTATPGHYPHILNDIKHLKWTLMQVRFEQTCFTSSMSTSFMPLTQCQSLTTVKMVPS